MLSSYSTVQFKGTYMAGVRLSLHVYYPPRIPLCYMGFSCLERRLVVVATAIVVAEVFAGGRIHLDLKDFHGAVRYLFERH